MHVRHALEHALLQCTADSHNGCSLRLTVKCVPQGKMCRSRGVEMTKFEMTKADLYNEVHLYGPQPAPAAAMLPPSPSPPMGPCFCRVSTGSLQTMAPRDLQVQRPFVKPSPDHK